MNCTNNLRWGKVRLSGSQRSLINAAFSCLQMSACFYLGDFLKHYMAHLVMLSIFIVTVIALQVLRESGGEI
jgi:hypothetical protein